MANTENIEAKLCAYIDGDLDAQGRAEIEKHLAANPQHRGLIEQLSKQRDLLRQLPREEARWNAPSCSATTRRASQQR